MKRGALKAVTDMNRMRLRGKVVFVGEAKYRRVSDVRDTNKVQPREDNRIAMDLQRPPKKEANQKTSTVSTKELAKEKIGQDPHENGWTKKVEVAVAKENLDWLQKSLVGGSTKAIDFRSLKDFIAKNFPQVIQVREMGAYKVLMTFDSLLNAEETYTFKMNSLLQLFHSVWRWDESEKSETRRV
ncbi:hypothetical protein AHAS_Ahas19G0196200 [Arachis hypogaea]